MMDRMSHTEGGQLSQVATDVYDFLYTYWESPDETANQEVADPFIDATNQIIGKATSIFEGTVFSQAEADKWEIILRTVAMLFADEPEYQEEWRLW